jgi:hypothetical protein
MGSGMTEEEEKEEMAVIKMHLNSVLPARHWTIFVAHPDNSSNYAVTTLPNLKATIEFLKTNLKSLEEVGVGINETQVPAP